MIEYNKIEQMATAISNSCDKHGFDLSEAEIDLIALDVAESYKPQIKKLHDIIDFIYTHNKNYTKKQWDCIIELKEIVEEGSAEK
jgi:hypothetical protein